MTDAYDDGNPQVEGQPIDNVGQDEGQTFDENSEQNWEEQAKYSNLRRINSQMKIRI